MRKILLGVVVFLVVLVAALALAPVLFKGKLRALADRQIAQRVRAQVQYDPANIDVSLLGSFPDMTVNIREPARDWAGLVQPRHAGVPAQPAGGTRRDERGARRRGRHQVD
ncbi:hypothetical protein ACFQT0_04030 [Hymenobacter humi]|uniref:AsmA family protein n=1 Tax=Hymenobacter humi TaxID=1411620 RepID=A0ABW2U001_9BACT